MKRHFENEITYLKDAVLRLGSEVEEALSTAVSAAIGGNVEIADSVLSERLIAGQIDRMAGRLDHMAARLAHLLR